MHSLRKLAEENISYADEGEVQIMENFRPGRQEWNLRGEKSKKQEQTQGIWLPLLFFFFFLQKLIHKAASEYVSQDVSKQGLFQQVV